MSNILPVPTPKDIAIFFGDRDAKVIETATLSAGSLTNKTIGNTNTIDVKDSGFQVSGSSDTTKLLKVEVDGMTASKTFTIHPISDVNSAVKFDLSGSTTAKYASFKAAVSADRTYTFPDASITVASLAGAEVFENKSLETTCKVVDATDNTKAMAFTLSGATTGKTVTIISAHSDNRSLTLPNSTGTVALTSDIGTDVRATATVSLTSAEILDIYNTPKQIIAAPAAGQAIIVEHIELLHTYAVAQYTGGGVCKLQYKNTAQGAGVVLGPDIDSIVKAGSTSNGMWSVTNTNVDMADVTAQGVFLSNATGVYADGNAGNVLKVRVSYRVVTVLA